MQIEYEHTYDDSSAVFKHVTGRPLPRWSKRGPEECRLSGVSWLILGFVTPVCIGALIAVFPASFIHPNRYVEGMIFGGGAAVLAWASLLATWGLFGLCRREMVRSRQRVSFVISQNSDPDTDQVNVIHPIRFVIELDDKGACISTTTGSKKVLWAAIEELVIAADYLFLEQGEIHPPVLIPRRCFGSQEDEDAFLNVLATNCDANIRTE